MDKYKLLHYLHFLIPLSIVLMPLIPNKYLFYIFPYPIIYYFIWLKYDECPISRIVKNNSDNLEQDKNFIQALFNGMNIVLNKKQSDRISYIIITLSIIVSAYKLILSKNYNCKK